jgi:hypothetical protein
MQSEPLLDRVGRRRSRATTSEFRRGVPARNKGLRYRPDPLTVEKIIAVMRAGSDTPDGVRLRAVIMILWRAGPRIREALALNEIDLDPERGATYGDKRREVGHADLAITSRYLHGIDSTEIIQAVHQRPPAASRRGAVCGPVSRASPSQKRASGQRWRESNRPTPSAGTVRPATAPRALAGGRALG